MPDTTTIRPTAPQLIFSTVERSKLSDRSIAYNVLFNTGLNDAAGNTLTLRIACTNKETAEELSRGLNGACWVEQVDA